MRDTELTSAVCENKNKKEKKEHWIYLSRCNNACSSCYVGVLIQSVRLRSTNLDVTWTQNPSLITITHMYIYMYSPQKKNLFNKQFTSYLTWNNEFKSKRIEFYIYIYILFPVGHFLIKINSLSLYSLYRFKFINSLYIVQDYL